MMWKDGDAQRLIDATRMEGVLICIITFELLTVLLPEYLLLPVLRLHLSLVSLIGLFSCATRSLRIAPR